MKKLIMALFLLCMSSQVSALNSAQRCKCDTILWRGNMSQLQHMERAIRQEMQKDCPVEDKVMLYTLEGRFQLAMGHYAIAWQWFQKAIDTAEQQDLDKLENLLTFYTYCEALEQQAYLAKMQEEPSERTLLVYNKAIEQIGKWLDKALGHLAKPLVKERYLYLNIRLRILGGDVAFLGRWYNNALEDYQEAIEGINFCFSHHAGKTMEYAEVLERQGYLHERMDNYEQALDYYKEAKEVALQCVGSSMQEARLNNRIGTVYYMLNDIPKAAACCAEANIKYAELGLLAHPAYAELELLGCMIYLNAGLYSKSLQAVEEAEAIYGKQCGEKGNLRIKAHILSSYPLLALGKPDEAWDRLEVMFDSNIFESVHSDTWLNGTNQAIRIGLVREEFSDLLDLEKDLMDLIEEVYFKDKISPDILYELYINWGRIHMAVGHYDKAADYYARALKLHRNMTHNNFMFLLEHQRELFWQRDETRFQSVLDMNRIAPAANSKTARLVGQVLYDAALLQKGLQLQASINLASVVAASGNRQLAEDMLQLRIYRKEYEERGKQVPESVRQLEERVIRQARAYGDFMQFSTTTWKEVQRALKPGDVAIEFVSSIQDGKTVYSAEVVTAQTAAPVHLPLFTLENGQHLSSMPEASVTRETAKRIWTEKLSAMLSPGGNVYFTPTGELYNCPIEYLPTADGRPMNKVYRMHRLSSTRILAEQTAKVQKKQAVLFGGLNYDTTVEDMQLYASAEGERGGKTRDFDLQGTKGFALWKNLQGTYEEVVQVDRLLKQGQYKTQVYSGDEGLEESFKALDGKHIPIIHIATHGFFLPGKGDALLRSGLVFAGANNFWGRASAADEEVDDGILSAREIAGMNLQGTSLVVMSACQTGLGEVTGEGVFGLQRAFKKAGTGSLLMSLWEVDDEATQVMMTHFYQALLQGKSKRLALQEAQEKVKAMHFTRNGQTVSGSIPYYWAAFVLMDGI